MKIVANDGPKLRLGHLEPGSVFYTDNGSLCLKLNQQCSEGAIRCGTSNVVVVVLATNCAVQMPRSEMVLPVEAHIVTTGGVC